jgi:glycosyltransferase involved in cell wall biosynthesis
MTVNAQALVTVITPTYNRAPYLRETIESVLNQGYPKIEYIVLDDGSTDNTQEVLKGYSGRLYWNSHPNMGEARTVNKGWAMARGEFVVVVNSDDPILPGLLETAVNIMQDNPELLVVYPDWLVIDEHSKPLKEVEAWDYDYKKMLLWAACIPGPGAVIQRKAFDYEPSRNPKYRYVTDLEYWLRLGLHGPFMRIPQVLATHRHHAHSAGVAEVKTLASELVGMMNEFFNRLDLPAALRPLRNQALSAANFDACIRCLNYPGLSRRFPASSTTGSWKPR